MGESLLGTNEYQLSGLELGGRATQGGFMCAWSLVCPGAQSTA